MKQLALVPKKRVHIAIMKKSWGLTPKLLTGEKTIETRWHKNRSRPWNQVATGEVIYFKESGEPVKIKAIVKKVLQFENLNSQKVKKLLKKFAGPNGLGIKTQNLEKYYQMFKEKKYCLIIFLKDVKKIKPFEINKSGFGKMATWLTFDNINQVKKT